MCASGGIFAFGADATATSQLGSPASFQSVTVGASADLEIGLGLSGGEAATLFSNGTASDSVTGLLAGISVSTCAGCVDFPVGLSFGVGPLDWTVQPLSDSSAATVNQGLQDMKTATMLACLTVTAACPLAIGPYAGYFGPELATAFADLQQVLAVP